VRVRGLRQRLATDLDRSWNRDDLMRLEPADVVIRV
jgi:hypothetical protein